MPQMAPMNWLYLFILFIMILLMINSMIYFFKTYKNNFMIQKKNIELKWKW
uniref:ATP synthase complex subunit 8 n=1 Tax=Bicellonychia lividipennis TaxID=1176499 RepID=A0A161ANY2_9COLE|nr:ATP synthase F0 subunit 8 [Bicellonychia lividipennis]AIQ80138.1 ATP synthase F0 subunit 8 [Bicellonychia lividipennis]